MTHYPDAPGWKARDTAQEAAKAQRGQSYKLQRDIIALLAERGAMTPEEIAEALGNRVMNIRPRMSELAAKGAVIDSNERRRATGGRMAIAWRVA
jgi:predicted ArsR family transcriptional regulator